MATSPGNVDWKSAKSIYDFSAIDIDGNEVSLEKYRGHVTLIVNLACKCGLTSQNYQQLQALHEKYAESQGLRILGFPCNQFAGQNLVVNDGRSDVVDISNKRIILMDVFYNIKTFLNKEEPGSESEIKEFIKQYNVQFDMFSKIHVNGDKTHPLWSYLKKQQGGTLGDFIKWNFTKFLIDKNGQPVKRYAPNVEPNAMEPDLLKYFQA